MKKNNINKGPWYKRYNEYKTLAEKYISSYNNLEKSQSVQYEIDNFYYNSIYSLIFESNQMEDAGTKTLGETKRIFLDENIDLSFTEINYKPIISLDKIPIYNFLNLLHKFDNLTEYKHILLSFKGKSKTSKEVLQHYNAKVFASNIARITAILFNIMKLIKNERTLGISDEEIKNKYLESFRKNDCLDDFINTTLFSVNLIKNLHSIIAEDLLPNDAEVTAGEFRNYDDITIGNTGLIFPAAKNIDNAMKNFCKQSNEIINNILSGEENDIFYAAAKISYNFVRIHPFPDFNGRISRIILNMVLWSLWFPFCVSLRGNKKEKHKYLVSLKRADNGDLIPYSALIAKRIVEIFQEFDKNLVISGLPSILN